MWWLRTGLGLEEEFGRRWWKNEGKRLGRLLDTCVNESECTDLKIGQEFDFGKKPYWAQEGTGMKSEGRKKEKGKKREYRKQKSHEANANGK